MEQKKEKAAQAQLRAIEMRVRKVEGMLNEAINQHGIHEKTLAEKRDEGMEYLGEELQMINQVRELLAAIRSRSDHRMDGKEYRDVPTASTSTGASGFASGATGSSASGASGASGATGATGATGVMDTSVEEGTTGATGTIGALQ